MSTTVIRATRTGELGLIAESKELLRYRHLVKTLVERELRSRYKNSVLGIGWSLVSPIVQVIILTFVLRHIMATGPANLSIFIMCGMIPWWFFQSCVLDSATAVLGRIPLIKKVYFPREILLISSVCQNFVNFAITVVVFIVYRWIVTPIFFGWPGPPPLAILWFPLVTIFLLLFTMGISFFICTANVFFEDVKYITAIMTSMFFYLLPIMYFAENIVYTPGIQSSHLRDWGYHIYLGVPLVWFVTAFKQMFCGVALISAGSNQVSAPFDVRYMAINGVLSVLVFIAGYSCFNKYKWRFAERP
jgi:ABC-type polysaccharide/polyol phosphate export permease